MDAASRDLVRRRAGDRCEYCLLRQVDLPYFTFHIEHILPRKHGGGDDVGNLALACDRCNLHKGANLTGVDPQTGVVTLLFNPRHHRWDEHFQMADVHVVGLTDIGRATVTVLNMNDPRRLRLRSALMRERS